MRISVNYGFSVGAIKRNAGSITPSIENTVRNLINYHFTTDHTNEKTEQCSIFLYVCSKALMTNYLDRKKTERTTKRMNKGKTPKLDGLPLEIVEEIYLANKPLFKGLLNKCLTSLFPISM